MTGSYSAPMRSAAPSGSPSAYTDPKQIDLVLKSSSPEAVAASGRSYQKFATAYEKLARELLTIRTDLHEAWGGTDAAAAQSALREVWAAATTVHKTAQDFGAAVERHGSESLAWYKYDKPPSTDLSEAQSWMTGANERISQSWSSLPPDISTTLPKAASSADHRPAGTGSGGTGGSSSAAPLPGAGTGKGGGSAPGVGGGPPYVSTDPGFRTGEGAGGTDTRLAGAAPLAPGGTGSGDLGGVGLPSNGAGGVPGGGMSSAPGGSSVFSPMGPGGIGNPMPGTIGPAGSAIRPVGGAAPAAEAAESNTAARAGMTGPVVGFGHDRDGRRDRSRRAWLAEDEEVWTGGIQPGPQLIGGDPAEGDTSVTPVAEADASFDVGDLMDLLDDLGGEEDAEDPSAEVARLRARLEELEARANPVVGPDATADDDLWTR